MSKIWHFLLVSLSLFVGTTSLGSDTRWIHNFAAEDVTCTDDVTGVYGKAVGVAGEGAGEVDVRIVDLQNIPELSEVAATQRSMPEYRKVICQTLQLAKSQHTLVDLQVRRVTVPEPEGDSVIDVVEFVTLGNRPSE